MDREGFKNRLKQYKQAREENPGLKYWEWKNIPKYGEGIDGVDDDLNTSGIKTVFTTDGADWRKRPTQEQLDAFYSGNVKRQVKLAEQTGQTVTYTNPKYTLDEVVVTAKDLKKQQQRKQEYNNVLDLGIATAGFVPGLGEVADATDVVNQVRQGNYSDAATSNKQQPLVTKKLDPDVSEFYKDVVIPMNPNDEVYKQYFMKQFVNPDIEIHPASNLPDNFAADYNPNTNKIRIREDYAMSPNYQQIEAHEYGHLLDKYLPYDETTQQQLNNSLKVSKAPISKDSDTYRERQSSKREGELKAFLNLKKAGKMKVKTSRAKTKRYQEYLANASDEEILELLGADTAYKQDYLAGNIDIDTLRQQMIYAPTITAGLVVPEYLLIDDEEEKQWT